MELRRFDVCNCLVSLLLNTSVIFRVDARNHMICF